jgi:Flp pilus assembly pilin Flp
LGPLGNATMIDTLRMACREEDGQNIAEYALILAMILVLVGGSIRLIVYSITGQ